MSKRSFVPRVETLEGREVPATLIASGLADPYGSTVGPDGYLYVTEGGAGRVARINPRTGHVSTFASGLPICPIPGFFGVGAVDLEFLGRTAYVLVSSVAEDLGGTDVVGIYRVDGPSSFTVVADLGAWALANPPDTAFEVPTGSPIAMESYRGGFLVSDSHHNRVLDVRLDGTITEVIAFGNLVPTGLAIRGNTVYLGQAGPLPHLPADGKVVSFGTKSPSAEVVASGARLIVDVEFGRGNELFALSGGVWDSGFPGDPPLPDTGSLVRVRRDGTFALVEGGLDRPSSLEFIRSDAYVVSISGEVWRLDNVGRPGRNGPLGVLAASDRHPSGGADDALIAFTLGGVSGGRSSWVEPVGGDESTPARVSLGAPRVERIDRDDSPGRRATPAVADADLAFADAVVNPFRVTLGFSLTADLLNDRNW